MRRFFNRQQPRTPYAAGAGLALLLGCLFLFSSCALPGLSDPPTYTITVTPLPTSTPGPEQAITLQDIHMVDKVNGWALSQDKAHILHTTTGPEHWQEATPSTGEQQFTLGTTTSSGSQDAWVSVTSASRYSIFHTFDDGNLWTETPLLDDNGEVTQISFVDELHGWLLFTKGTSSIPQGSSPTSENVDIFNTTDGGASWFPIATTDNNAHGQIPFHSLKTGITFLDTATGWLTGSEADGKNAWLYVTHDSGTTWKTQPLQLPSSKDQAITMPPTFFDANNGIMPVTVIEGQEKKLDIYTTTDGGNTWKSTTPTSNLTTSLSFADNKHGWTIGANQTSLYGTSDGGQEWTEINSALAPNITSIDKLNFVSATQGWAIATTSAETNVLLQTTDGGKSWTSLKPGVSA